MLTVSNTETCLKNRIGENTNDIKKVWEEFKAFSKEAVEGEDVKEILFQCGVDDYTEKKFYFDFVRQFTILDEEDEYSHMEQLLCSFEFKPTDELCKFKVTEWSMYFEDIDEFFNHIESLQEFKVPLNLKPIKSEVYQTKV
ncbi:MULTISPECIES: hypothetical protein [unclassified Lysinibacillus]|uniref:hypothetical protein n=1 Tax=unclassified Lysinibacillus TaxID=2636778 RepID=UPI0025543088|nr:MULTISPECIES: hypothetical protein [unclassified Lysinibacillus]MDM5250993.1 hypothetical protein [Lysinibacillus sp. G4S2]